MDDMLVRLYDLPKVDELELKLNQQGIIFRHPIAPEKDQLANWTREYFSEFWGNEVEVAFSRLPVSCIIAQQNQKIIGFACYETTSRGFFGPTGVLETFRGKKIGRVLLIKALQALRNIGYAYGIIGGVGPAEYYQKNVDAWLIPDSKDSVYKHLLRKTNESK